MYTYTYFVLTIRTYDVLTDMSDGNDFRSSRSTSLSSCCQHSIVLKLVAFFLSTIFFFTIMSPVANAVPSSLTLRWCSVAGRQYLQRFHDPPRLYYRKLLSSSSHHNVEKEGPLRTNTAPPVVAQQQHRRVWKSSSSASGSNDNIPPNPPEYWHTRVYDLNHKKTGSNSHHTSGSTDGTESITSSTTDTTTTDDSPSSSNTTTTTSVDALIRRVASSSKPQHDGRLRQKQLGVLHQDPATDMQLLIDNYTVKAVASALRDREDCLQQAAILAADGKLEELQQFLQIFHPKYVLERRQNKSHRSVGAEPYTSSSFDRSRGAATADPVVGLDQDAARQVLRKALMRMPRTVTTAHSKRAAVCLALCSVQNVPSLLLEKRAAHLRLHPDEVCLPGGMVCDIQDTTIANTSIREMREEIGGLENVPTEVLGVLRLNWGEVQHLVGVAVTPVVCYLGELPEQLTPNPEEVSEVFTIPLVDLLDRSFWVYKDGLAPIFVGGPHLIWGLTGYILNRFGKDVLAPLHRHELSARDEGPGLEASSGNLLPPPHKRR